MTEQKDTRRSFTMSSDGPFDYLMAQKIIRPVPGSRLKLRRYGCFPGKYVIVIDGNEHGVELKNDGVHGISILCEPDSIRPVYRILRDATKYLQSQIAKKMVIRPILPKSIFDLLDSAVFDFYKAIDALCTTRGFGNVGIILTGPAGVGKTETMRWLREEAYATYKRGNFQLGLSQLHKILVDGTPLNTDKALFFIDDIDANLLRDRKITKNALTSQFLTCLDGMEKQEGRVMVVSTNERIDDGIDPALLRPGRFDHVIQFEYPTVDLIEQFCQERAIDVSPTKFEGWSFARIDMFMAKFRVAEYLHQTPIATFYEKFIYEMGETDSTVEAYAGEAYD